MVKNVGFRFTRCTPLNWSTNWGTQKINLNNTGQVQKIFKRKKSLIFIFRMSDFFMSISIPENNELSLKLVDTQKTTMTTLTNIDIILMLQIYTLKETTLQNEEKIDF